VRRKQAKLVRELNELLRLISSETRGEVFGEDNDKEIWRALNTSIDHRIKVIEWPDVKITNAVTNEIHEMADRIRTWQIQDT
jgi:hypothetical protein